MKGFHRTRRALLAGALAIGGAAAFSAAAPATAQDAEGVTIATRIGVLRLYLTDSGGTVTFEPDSGEASATQTVTVNNKCAVSTSGDRLLTFSAPSPPHNKGPGLTTHGMGVRTLNNCQRMSGQVANGEALRLALAEYFDEDSRMSRAELDIEGWNEGSKLGVQLDEGPLTTHSLSWNGNGELKNNTRVVIEGITRSLTLTAGTASSEVALKGGFGENVDYEDYEGAGLIEDLGSEYTTADTIFEISSVKTYEHALGCGDDPIVATVEDGGDEIATFASVTRLPNSDGSECEDIGVTFKITPEGVLLDKSMVSTEGNLQDVHAQVAIVYAPVTPEVPLQARQINFLGALGGPEDFRDITWCAESEGEWIHPADVDDEFEEIGFIPWCLIDNQEVPSGDMIVQTQVYDGLGDPMWR